MPARSTFDLDRAELERPLCAPLRAPARGLAVRGRDAATTTLDAYPELGLPYLDAVAVRRCGRRAPVFEHTCRRACASVSLGPAGLLWVEGRRVRLWRRGTAAPVTVTRPPAFGARAVQTRQRIVVGSRAAVDGPWTISTVPTSGAGRR